MFIRNSLHNCKLYVDFMWNLFLSALIKILNTYVDMVWGNLSHNMLANNFFIYYFHE